MATWLIDHVLGPAITVMAVVAAILFLLVAIPLYAIAAGVEYGVKRIQGGEMKSLIVIAVALLMSSVAMAETANCLPPCPEIQVTCQCNCNEVELPGLWEVMIHKEIRCGTITVVGSGFTLSDGKGHPEFFLINKLKRANQVESCPDKDTTPPASP